MNKPHTTPANPPHHFVIFIFVISLILLTLMTVIPESTAKTSERQRIPKDDHWSQEIEKPNEGKDEEWTWEINIKSDDVFDVYILEERQYSNYRNGNDFTARIEIENVNETGWFNFSIKAEDRDHYLVVDNMNNSHDNDAEAGKQIEVWISIEKQEGDFNFGGFIGVLCFGFCALPVVIIVLIFLWIPLEPRLFPQGQSSKFLTLMQKPAFQTVPVNPPVERSPPPPPPAPTPSPQSGTPSQPQHYPQKYPPQGSASGQPTQYDPTNIPVARAYPRDEFPKIPDAGIFPQQESPQIPMAHDHPQQEPQQIPVAHELPQQESSQIPVARDISRQDPPPLPPPLATEPKPEENDKME